MISALTRFHDGLRIFTFSIAIILASIFSMHVAGAAEDSADSPDASVAAEPEKTAQPEDSTKSNKPAEKDQKAGDAEKVKVSDAEKVNVAGDPLAPGKIKLLQEEILGGFKRRGTTDNLSLIHI